MPISQDELSVAMSNLALLQDNHPTHTADGENKAALFDRLLADKTSDEAYHMLATYCFDVSKRFAILHAAICIVCDSANPTSLLAQLISEDNKELNMPGLNWKQRCEIAGRQLKVWHDRASKTNKQYVDSASIGLL